MLGNIAVVRYAKVSDVVSGSWWKQKETDPLCSKRDGKRRWWTGSDANGFPCANAYILAVSEVGERDVSYVEPEQPAELYLAESLILVLRHAVPSPLATVSFSVDREHVNARLRVRVLCQWDFRTSRDTVGSRAGDLGF